MMYYVSSIMYRNFKICLLLLVACCLLPVASASAQTMSNDNYIIRMQGFNAISGVSAGQDYNVRSTVGDLSPAVSEGVNFKVKAGFENLTSNLPFSFSLSSNIIDFGALSPTNPVIRTLDLNINSLTTYGYSVLVFENQSLTATQPESKTTIIPDATCDNGMCDAQNAAEWTNALTYGFGYRCDNTAGVDCDSSFTNTNSYKHFPNVANNDDPQSIMAGIGSNNKETRISYKVNISGTQAQGTYSNIITYIAIPNF